MACINKHLKVVNKCTNNGILHIMLAAIIIMTREIIYVHEVAVVSPAVSLITLKNIGSNIQKCTSAVKTTCSLVYSITTCYLIIFIRLIMKVMCKCVNYLISIATQSIWPWVIWFTFCLCQSGFYPNVTCIKIIYLSCASKTAIERLIHSNRAVTGISRMRP